MANSILHKRSGTANNVPNANALSYGEIAVNYADAKAFIKNSSNVVVELGSNVTTANVGNLSVSGNVTSNLIPSANVTYDLGSPTRMWRDIYVGPGSLYVNGQKVLEDQSGTIVVAADTNQNLSLQTSGTGDIEFAPQATGVIAVKGTTQFDPAYNISTTDGNALPISVGVKTDSITAKTANTNLSLSGSGTGYVGVSSDMVVTGNLTVNGSTANLSVTNLSVQDNIINIASETTGAAANNAGLQVVRGDDPNVQFRWNETTDTWQFTTDGSTYKDLVGSSSGNVSVGNLTISSDTISSSNATITIDPSTAGAGGNVVIQGNLQVTGTTTTVNSTTVEIADLNLTLAKDAATAAAASGAGITVAGANAQITYSSTGDKWTVNKSLDLSGNMSITGNIIPTTDVTYDLGSSSFRFRDLYMSGNTIYLGGSKLSRDANGDLEIRDSSSSALRKVRSESFEVGSGNGASRLKILNSSGTLRFLDGDDIAAPIETSAITKSGANGSGNIGQTNNRFNTVFATATSAQYADLAEKYAADVAYEPGTVVCFGGTAEVTVCDHDADRRVAGVVSTNPAYIMNDGLDAEYTVAIALQGRVPTKVVGPVTKGDMMVSAGNGRARAEANPTVGSVIGKALEDFSGNEGTIEVVVGRI